MGTGLTKISFLIMVESYDKSAYDFNRFMDF